MGDMQFNGSPEEWDALVKKSRQTTVKLYTEEQVKEIIDDAHNGVDGYYDIFKKHKPIELPSDEEILALIGDGMHDYYKGGFEEGAKWMRDKILNK